MIYLKGVWANSTSLWPRDTKEHVFLARAVERVGKALHAEEWTSEEPRTEVVESLPPDPKGAPDYLKLRAQSYLERNHPQLAQPRSPSPLGFPFTFRFSPEGWETAVKYFADRHRETQVASQRFWGSVEEVLDALAEGKLKSALRPCAGGAIGKDLPETHWHTEIGHRRFISCRMSETHPFDVEKTTHWIFIERVGLDHVLSGLDCASSGTSADRVRCFKFLVAEMAQSPNEKRHPKDWYRKRAQEELGYRSVRGFNAAWDQALIRTGANWDRAGPLKKAK